MAQSEQSGQLDSNRDAAPSAEASRRRKPWFKRPLPWIGTLVTAVVTGVAVTLASSYTNNTVSGDSHGAAPSAGQAARLQVDEVSLTAATGPDNSNRLTPFKIDIKLLNTGSQVAAVNHVRLVIQQFVSLPLCATQGGFVSTGTYVANMPTAPVPGQVVDVPISQLVPAGGADRFDVLLSPPLHRNAQIDTVHVYRLHAYLTYNMNTRPVDLGEILTAFPYVPDAGEYFWSHYYAANPKVVSGFVYAPEIPAYKRCEIRNSQTLRSILALPGKRTAGLAAIPKQLAY